MLHLCVVRIIKTKVQQICAHLLHKKIFVSRVFVAFFYSPSKTEIETFFNLLLDWNLNSNSTFEIARETKF
jgi:hypothetical protein